MFERLTLFFRPDGSFTISNVPSGSYLVEAVNPDYAYEPVRVEINSKGKFRARKVNYIQTSQVVQMPYPLKMKPLARFRYFQMREQWRATDFLFSPMVNFYNGLFWLKNFLKLIGFFKNNLQVLMMVLPLLLIMILPKMMNDPETRRVSLCFICSGA